MAMFGEQMNAAYDEGNMKAYYVIEDQENIVWEILTSLFAIRTMVRSAR